MALRRLGKAPTFDELFRNCRSSAVHLEMRDGYMKSDPVFIDWHAGRRIDPAERWPEWHELVPEATGRGWRYAGRASFRNPSANTSASSTR